MKREEKIKAMKPGELFRELKVRIKNVQDLQKVAGDTQAVSLTLAISYQVKSAKELAVEIKNRRLTPKGWMKDELQKCNIVDRTFWLSDEVADKLTARRAAMANTIFGKETKEETQVDPEEIQEPLVLLNEGKVEKDIELKMSEIASIPSVVKEKIDIKTINAIPSLIKSHAPKVKLEIKLDKAIVAFDKFGAPVKAFDKGTKWIDIRTWVNSKIKKPTEARESVIKYNIEGVAKGKKYIQTKKAKAIAYGFQWRYYKDVKAR